MRETVDLMLKAFPMRTLLRLDLQARASRPAGPACSATSASAPPRASAASRRRSTSRSPSTSPPSWRATTRRYVARPREAHDARRRAALDYEAAARYRDQIGALRDRARRRARVVLADDVDADVFGIAHDELAAAVQQFIVRGGRIRGVRGWVVDKELDVELPSSSSRCCRTPTTTRSRPARDRRARRCPTTPPRSRCWLERRRAARERGRVVVRSAQRGDKAALAQTVALERAATRSCSTRRDAAATSPRARRRSPTSRRRSASTEAPLRMECYDVSHLSGTNIVASMVVFEDGLPRKDQYRTFSIARVGRRHRVDLPGALATTRLPQDRTDGVEVRRHEHRPRYAVSAQPAPRRRRRKKFHYRPELLIVDGGQPQVRPRSARSTMRASPASSVRHREATRGDLAARLRLPRHPAAQQRRAVPPPAHPRRGAPLRHQLPAQKRKQTSPPVLSRSRGSGPSRVQRAAQALRLGRPTAARRALDELIGEVDGIGPALAETDRRARLSGRPRLSWMHTTRANEARRMTDTPRPRGADRHRDVRCGPIDGRQCPRRPRLVRRRQPAAADAAPARRPRRARRERNCPRSPPSSTSAAAGSSPICRRIVEELRDRATVRVLFLEATDAALVRRFEQVRRPHPLQEDGTLLDGIAARARAHARDARAQRHHHRHDRAQHPPAGDDRVGAVLAETPPRPCASPSRASASSTACRPTPTWSPTPASCPTRSGMPELRALTGVDEPRERLRARPGRGARVRRAVRRGARARARAATSARTSGTLRSPSAARAASTARSR